MACIEAALLLLGGDALSEINTFLNNSVHIYLSKSDQTSEITRTFSALDGLTLCSQCDTGYQHDEQGMSLSNLPDPGKVEFVVDGHAAFGNPTDLPRPLLARRVMLCMLNRCHQVPRSTAIREHQP